MTTREQVFSALFALGSALTWTDPTTAQPVSLLATSRRVKTFDDMPMQPAFCQAEGDENLTQTVGMPYKQKMTAHWLFFHKAGANADAIPAATNNAIMDAAVAALGGNPDLPRLTLGGLVNRVWIEGKVFKDPGDIDTQGLVIIPISILLPD